MEKTFGEDGQRPDFPFSPTAAGAFMTKPGMIKAVQKVHRNITGPKHIDDDKKPWGHVFRISGPRHMARNGVAPQVIMRLAHWGSNTIWRYLRDTPLTNLTKDYVRGRSHQKHSDVLHDAAKVKQLSTAAFDRMKAIEKRIQAQESQLAELVRRLDDEPEQDSALGFVISDKYNKWHRTLPWQPDDRSSWRTPCGWSYGASIFDRAFELPGDLDRAHMCPRCFPVRALPDSDVSAD